VSPAEVASVTCEIFQSGFDIAGGGSFGLKDHPMTKEHADYNLKYLIAAALLDDQVGPAQLEEARVNAADAQALLARVDIRPDRELTARYPEHLDCRVTIRMASGATYGQDQRGHEGGLERPLTWARVVEKFHWLAEPYADAELRDAIVAEVEVLEHRPLAELMRLLGRVEPRAMHKATLRGIQ